MINSRFDGGPKINLAKLAKPFLFLPLQLIDKDGGGGGVAGGAEVDASPDAVPKQKDGQSMPADEMRFIMSSEVAAGVQQQNQQVKTAAGGEVSFVETGFGNGTTNDAMTQPNTEEHELETRLK